MTESKSNGNPAWKSLETLIVVFTLVMLLAHFFLRFSGIDSEWIRNIPLWLTLLLGGGPLVYDLLLKLIKGEFGSDLLAGISIATSAILGEYLAGALVVLMLSGGGALEAYAVRQASYVLLALSRRMPSVAHRRNGSEIEEVALNAIAIGDTLIVLPHEVCPIDGTVTKGQGTMNEAYLTGEPYEMSKAPGSAVISGAINGDSALDIRADKLAVDSRYAKIMQVMETSQENKPQMRRLADRLGAWYTPVAVAIGVFAWAVSGDPIRFLAVMVVATPCPLLIAIPVAIVGSISLAAKRAIIVRDPSALELADSCGTLIFDKTGTLTYGEPKLTEMVGNGSVEDRSLLSLVASLEQYSKHPLAVAIQDFANESGIALQEVSEIHEPPGEGLWGIVDQRRVEVTSRKKFLEQYATHAHLLPEQAGGLECVILLDGEYASTYRFRDTPRPDGASFIRHLSPRHAIHRTMIVSGDRESEVRFLAERVGIDEVHFSQTPEQKVAIVSAETTKAPTIYVGDGINDAPALMSATIGIAFGQNSDVTSEAADVVVMDSSLRKVDEFLHISKRMRSIALQSALGGMALSVGGMLIATAGYLPPVAGAVFQEVIDVIAVLNALRAAMLPKSMIDFESTD